MDRLIVVGIAAAIRWRGGLDVHYPDAIENATRDHQVKVTDPVDNAEIYRAIGPAID